GRADPGRRRAGRRLRAAARVHGRHRAVRRGLAGLRPGAQRRFAGGGARRAGAGRRADGARQPGPDRRDFRRPPARAGYRHLGSVTYGCTAAPTLGLLAPPVLLALGGGLALLAAFVAVEARSPHPMLPLGLFRVRTFSVTNLLTLCLYMGLAGLLLFLPLNLV